MVSDLLKALVLGPNILGLIAGLLVPAGLKWKPSAGLWLLAVMLNLLTVVTVVGALTESTPSNRTIILATLVYFWATAGLGIGLTIWLIASSRSSPDVEPVLDAVPALSPEPSNTTSPQAIDPAPTIRSLMNRRVLSVLVEFGLCWFLAKFILSIVWAILMNGSYQTVGLALTKLAAIGIAFGWCFWRYRRRTALQE